MKRRKGRLDRILINAARAAGLIAAAVALAPATASAATDTYVASGGTDAGTCPQGSPCLTITYALTQTDNGGTVHVSPGVYNESITVGNGKSVIGTPSDPTLTLINGATAVTVGATGAGTIGGFTIRGTTQPVTLNGSATVSNNLFDQSTQPTSFWAIGVHAVSTVQGNTFVDSALGAGTGQGGINVSSTAVGASLIDQNTLTGLEVGIDVFGNGVDPTISNNRVQGTNEASIGGAGIRISGDAQPLIADNTVSPAGAGTTIAIYILEAAGPVNPTGATLLRNKIIGHTYGLLVSETTGPVQLDGNLIVKATTRGVNLFDGGTPGSADADIQNSTIFDNGTDIFIGFAGGGTTHLNMDSSIVGDVIGLEGTAAPTCTITNSRGPTTVPGTSGCGGFSTIADPMFVDTGAANDYRLQPSSTLIDAGNPNPLAPPFSTFAQNLDLAGNPRVIAGTCGGAARRDMGAYEFLPSCPGPAAPGTPPPVTTPASTGLRAAALKKCKRKRGRARAKCKRKAKRLPV